jgi:hypothetical protein
MKVVQVKCPKCGVPIQSKQKDMLFHCQQCGILHVRNGGVTFVDYEIADFSRQAPREGRTYVPFWRMYSHFTILHLDSKGGTTFKLSNWVKGGKGDSGEMFVFVPAPDFDPPTFKRLATLLTMDWPKYSTRLDFAGVPRLPAAIKREEAERLAHFVVITMEAEKPGILQDLEYSLEIKDARIVYLPFIASANGLMPSF